jgi:hypothetical protein
MNIPLSLLSSLSISIFLGILYMLIEDRHPYALRGLEPIKASLKGFGTNAVIWLALLLIALALSESHSSVWTTFELILNTSLFFVPFVTWSMIVLPLVFQIEENSKGHLEYRVLSIVSILVIGFILGIYYWNWSNNPVRIP